MTIQTLSLPVHIKKPTTAIWVALGLGWSADLLFYGKMVGVSLLLFVLLFLGALITISKQEQVRPVRRNLWLLVPLLFFATMAFWRANAFLTTLNVLATFSLLSYIAFFYANSRISALGMVGAMVLPARVVGSSLVEGMGVLNAGINPQSLRNSKKHLYPILRGILLATPILIIFTILLTSADLIFAQYVKDALNINLLPNLVNYGWRGILIGATTWLWGGSLSFALSRANTKDDDSWIDKIVAYLPRRYALGLTETTTLMVLVNLLFLAFASIQFTYLFGGQKNITIAEYTFAQYARQGFFELITVAILTLGMILILNWITHRENKRQIKAFNLLSTLMVGFVIIMLLSAWRRMNLYESTFGYTQLRLYTYTFMAWMGVVLAWFATTLWKKPHLFTIGLILCAIGFLTTLNLINPDVFIARQNLARYQRSGDLDAHYLTTLSDDAVPQLVRGLALTQQDPETVESGACNYERRTTTAEASTSCYDTRPNILQNNLQHRFDQRTNNHAWQKWQSFHFSRWTAFQQLKEAVNP